MVEYTSMSTHKIKVHDVMKYFESGDNICF